MKGVLNYFFFIRPDPAQTFWVGLGWKWVQPAKFRKTLSFACKISACKWLSGKFQGGATLLGQRWRRLGTFLVLQGRSCMVAGDGSVARGGRKRGRKWGRWRVNKNLKKKKMIFSQLCTMISFSSGNRIYFFTYAKYWPSIWSRKISNIGSKLLSWPEKVDC